MESDMEIETVGSVLFEDIREVNKSIRLGVGRSEAFNYRLISGRSELQKWKVLGLQSLCDFFQNVIKGCGEYHLSYRVS